MKKINILSTILMAASVFTVTSCGTDKKIDDTGELTGTAKVVAEASKLSLSELEAKSKEEMENSNDTFKVVGLTSLLKASLTSFASKYDWIKFDSKDTSKNNAYCKSDYKDYQLLSALETAGTSYFADFALVQDVRSIADYDGDLLHNFVPSDWKAIGLSEEDTKPLKGVHFNKIFYTNTNFEKVTGKRLYNIWQLAGSESDADHLKNVSFQTPTTEQINMSFLLSCEEPANQARIEKAYKDYYNKDWSSDKYSSAGQQWVEEFIANISRWHSSDGTAMKETQLKDDWSAGYVYYGAFAKMKDAVGKNYDVDLDGNGTIEDNEKNINAMSTVKWDWEINGFNGFMYTMCSQIVNNAKHPYTACLYARNLLTLDCYSAAVYNSQLPAADGTTGTTAVNQYGYYFPASNNITYAKGDWDRDTHKAKELNENYSYLKDIKISQVNKILALVSKNTSK